MIASRDATAKVRVAYLVGDLGAGGAERQVVLLASALDRARFEPTLVTWRDRVFYRREIEAARIPLLHVPKGGRFDCRFPLRLREALLAGGFDVWHGWLEAGSFWARTLSRFAGARRPVVIASFRCPRMPLAYRRIEPFLQRYTDSTVVNGDGVRRALVESAGADPGRLVVSENAVDLARFFRERRPSAEEKLAARRATGLSLLVPGEAAALPWVALVSRLSPEKDPLTFVRAAASAARAGRPFTALLVGDAADGELAYAVRRLAAKEGIANRVFLFPAILEVERLYDAIDALALPSRYEGFPNVLVEAMAAGLPIAASAIDASVSALAGDPRARFAPVGSAELLAGAILSALESSEEPLDARRRRLERFSPSRMAREAEALYERWVAGRRGAFSLRSPAASAAGSRASDEVYASRFSIAQRTRP